MDFNEVFHIWQRRRALTGTLLILALASIVAALAGLPRAYQSQASVVLLASKSAARLTGGNPYLSFSSSLTLAADAVSRELMSPGIAQAMAASGATASYTVAMPTYSTATTGSVLVVTATGGDPAQVQSTLRGVTAEVGVALARIQGAVRRRDAIRVAVLSYEPQAVLDVSKTARPLVVVAVLALLLALAFPVLVDGWLSRRQIRGGALSPDGATDQVGHLVRY